MQGECPCISATVSFGMGVDKATVRTVVHWGVPQNVAAYYQVRELFTVVLYAYRWFRRWFNIIILTVDF